MRICLTIAVTLLLTGAVARAQQAELTWAGDPEGGAPYVEANPDNPDELVGFDVEIARLLARGLGRTPQFVFVTFTSLIQAVARGDAEIGLSGIEDTPALRATMAVTLPYYEFREVLAVRDADAPGFRTLKDLSGRRVGTLGGTMAFEILLRGERELGLTAVSYDDDVHPYEDLVNGRLDAVLLDNVLAFRRAQTVKGFTVQPASVAIGHYVGVLSADNAPLRDRCNEILKAAMQDGQVPTPKPWTPDPPTPGPPKAISIRAVSISR